MGTSSLYKGPKKVSLLPADYTPDENSEQKEPSGNTPIEEKPEESNKEPDKTNTEQNDSKSDQSSVRWSTARRAMRIAMNNRSAENIKKLINHYTRALGGHEVATKKTSKVRNTAGTLYSFFSGSPDAVHHRFVEAGINFNGRATREIFNDICRLIAPIPNDLEDSLINKALWETFADVSADSSIDLSMLDSFNEGLLQHLVGGLIKHYIFDKLILQSEQTALKSIENVSSLRELEKAIKIYIDGIVDSVLPDIIRNGLNTSDFNRALETLIDISYQQMEDLK